MIPYNLVYLPGFLGQEEDFAFLSLPGRYYSINPYENIEAWSKPFIEYSQKIPRPRSLIAYSLGGRLALSVLAQEPGLYDQVILISAHPGLSNEEEKKKRVEDDRNWADRFLIMPWEELMNKWNEQQVLSAHPIIRKEKHYCRKSLSEILINYSLGKQEFCGERRSYHHLIGEEDKKIAPFAPLFQSHLIPKAGHRLMWQQPDLVRMRILGLFG
jgi:2-succinyl-6-hydroxy-2,4-cyclohexadiene-1-carboxylate synthase